MHNQTQIGIKYLEEALQIFLKLGSIGAVNTMDSMGMCHQRLGMYDQSIYWYKQALEIGAQYKYYSGTANCNLGSIYLVLGDYEKALHEYHVGIRILQRKNMIRQEYSV